MMEDFLYNELNKAWKTTCKVLFKEEIGELKKYEGWLSEYVKPAGVRKDKEGKEVYVFPDHYKGNKFIDFKDINWNRRFEPLNINEIKDIDSIVEALKERFYYAGNIVLGKSEFVEKSTNVFDSFYVYKSFNVRNSKYIYNSSLIKDASYVFGSTVVPLTNYSIVNATAGISNRIFSSIFITTSSDVYYSAKIDNSTEIMFSFGLNGKSYSIGNLKLEKRRYYEIKNKLLGEIREELIKEKRIFTLAELINEIDEPEIKFEFKDKEEKNKNEDINIIERSFSKTARIVLKKELIGMDEYSNFLKRNVLCEVWEKKLWRKSYISGKKTYLSSLVSETWKPEIKGNRFFKFDEIEYIGNNHIKEEELEQLEITKNKLKKLLRNIAFISFEIEEGHNINVIESNAYRDAQNCYKGCGWIGRNSAFCFWPRESEYVFGSAEVFNSSFAINAYYSNNIQRAFEVDNVQNSSDVYFSHNVENVIEGMFNFNVKNLSYAIGNVKYDPETYRRIKASLLEQIANELEEKKDLKWSIYNIGSFKDQV